MIPVYFWSIPVIAIIALFFAGLFYRQVSKMPNGNEKMQHIAGLVSRGAMAYLKQQYKIVIIVFIFLSILFAVAAYGFQAQSNWTWVAFISGGFFSGLCGFFGMKASTKAAPRVAQAAKNSLGLPAKIAIRGGSVLSFLVVGFSLLDISVWYLILDNFVVAEQRFKLISITTTMLTFGMGASTQALFARLGGGIYTKAADVGADLIGKIEANIPEDDPRNPAVIADNVGDNVGDVAGMGADLYESYVGSILATTALAASAFYGYGHEVQLKYVFLPVLISALGIICSLIGVYSIRVSEKFNMKELVRAFNKGIFLSSILVVLSTFILTWWLNLENWLNISLCVTFGVVVGIIIGETTNYLTSQGHRPTKHVANSAKISPATVIIAGLSLGMMSTLIPVTAICLCMGLAYYFAAGFEVNHIIHGLYGIGIASVGMLSTLGITLATDAYGPIADNAGGNAEMAKLDPIVRERTDILDAVGNTTAAIGKGFAIGSAALTAMALLAAYVEEVRMALIRSGQSLLQFSDGSSVAIAYASMLDFMNYYQVHLMNIRFLVGIFLGAMIVMVFSGLCMQAVGLVAEKLVEEVRRQFKNARIISGFEAPDSDECIRITTRGAQAAMILPASLGIITPILVGLFLGVTGVMGLIMGCFSSGLVMALMMSGAGGSWDNAKKYIEAGNLGGKGSEAHKAAVIGDMVGDPFKDTAGPSLNILIKLVAMTSIVSVGVAIYSL